MKILYYIYGLNVGGAETFIFNVVSKIDIHKYQIDFVIQDGRCNNNKLVELCEEKNCSITVLQPFLKKPISHFVKLMEIIKVQGYDCVHIHANAFINILPIVATKLCKKTVILHSHNTSNNQGGRVGLFVHYINRFFFSQFVDIRIACGEEAGKWMYMNKKFDVIDNSIDVEQFSFSEEKRQVIRDKYNLDNCFVIGHVGRFVKAKNHSYLIKIFNEVLKINDNSKLVLVGEGELYEEIKREVIGLKIEDKVIFIGNSNETDFFYSAFDCLVFPSLFEGLPFVLVEAQAANLPIYVSKQVTREVVVSPNLIKFLDINDAPNIWASEILKTDDNNIDREKRVNLVAGSKYDITKTIRKLTELYTLHEVKDK